MCINLLTMYGGSCSTHPPFNPPPPPPRPTKKFAIYIENPPKKVQEENYRHDLYVSVPPVSLIPVVHLDLRISPRIFEKFRNDPYVIFRGLGEDDS
jgi:hypothetical protein